MRIGLVSDTHLMVEELPDEILRAFADVDLILHAGDIYAEHVLEQLQQIAPVFAVEGNGDRGRSYPKNEVPPARVFSLDGLRIGMVHELIQTGRPTERAVEDVIERLFGEKPDIFVFGHTHVPFLDTSREDFILVNPGSTTYPFNRMRQLGHVGLMEISEGQADLRIIDLKELADGRSLSP
jgi:putative phosphoesterase